MSDIKDIPYEEVNKASTPQPRQRKTIKKLYRRYLQWRDTHFVLKIAEVIFMFFLFFMASLLLESFPLTKPFGVLILHNGIMVAVLLLGGTALGLLLYHWKFISGDTDNWRKTTVVFALAALVLLALSTRTIHMEGTEQAMYDAKISSIRNATVPKGVYLALEKELKGNQKKFSDLADLQKKRVDDMEAQYKKVISQKVDTELIVSSRTSVLHAEITRLKNELASNPKGSVTDEKMAQKIASLEKENADLTEERDNLKESLANAKKSTEGEKDTKDVAKSDQKEKIRKTTKSDCNCPKKKFVATTQQSRGTKFFPLTRQTYLKAKYQ